MTSKNPMQAPEIEKVTINIGVGQGGEKLVKAETLLQKITNRKPVRTISKHKIPTWGIKKGDPIGCKVTLRGAAGEEFLKKALAAKDNRLKKTSIDAEGNISFGIPEYIDLPGVKYDPDIGILGMDVTVTMQKPGYRVKRRRIRPSKISAKHVVTAGETMEYFKQKYKTEFIEED